MQLVFSDGTFQPHQSSSDWSLTVMQGGTCTLDEGFTGTVTVNTDEEVTIDGNFKDFKNVNIVVTSDNADLTLRNLIIANDAATNDNSVVKFGTGTDNKLHFIGTNSLTTDSESKAAVNIGGGLDVDGTGGTLTVKSGTNGAGIGTDSDELSTAHLTVDGGTLTASAGTNGAGIGTGSKSSMGTVLISDGTVTGTSTYGAGIGTGYGGTLDSLTLSGGTLITGTSAHGAGIGTGYGDSSAVNSSVDYLIITDGTVTASSSTDGAGIGTGSGGTVGNIVIDGGTILEAIGGTDGAGIGSGKAGTVNGIDVSGGTITVANGGKNGACIRSGYHL